MARGPVIAGVALLGLGTFVCHQAVQLSLGQASRPGPGFVPFGLGSILVFLSLLYLLPQLRNREKAKAGGGFGRTFLAVGILCLFTFLLSRLGYLICTFLLFILWLGFIERKRWYVSLSLSLLALAAVYYFNLLFSVQLPGGPIKGF